MAKKPETLFREKVDKKLKTLPFSWFETVDQKSIIGSPDKIGCVAGRFVALEFKKDSAAKRGKLQVYKAFKIKEAFGIHFFVYPENWDEVYNTLLNMSQSFLKEL